MFEPLSKTEIFSMCKEAQKEAYGKISVGAVCHGQTVNDEGKLVHRYWSGANLHISDSFADVHAEQLAVNLALLERYYPTEIFVTSQSNKEDVRLCGSCRQYISEINRYCSVYVFNPDGSIKSVNTLDELYPFSKDTMEKNSKFEQLCKLHTEMKQ
jgi:cytidine deaminase